MPHETVQKAPLPWWVAGIVLGLVQVLAIAMVKPLGVSTQFAIIDSKVIHAAAPEYAQEHPLISKEKYRKIGYGFWLDVGIIAGAFISAVVIRRFRFSTAPIWWTSSHGGSLVKRFVIAFIGGFFILLGARFAHGCTSGQFASGWAQLSLSAIPFTITLFGFGMLTAWIFHRNVPEIEK